MTRETCRVTRTASRWADVRPGQGGGEVTNSARVDEQSSAAPAFRRSRIAHGIRILAVPILIGWILLTVVTNVFVPTLEKVGEAHTVSMNAHDAPAFIAMQKVGANFQEFDSDSNAM